MVEPNEPKPETEAKPEEGTEEQEEDIVDNWFESVEKFDDLNLKESVLRGIYGYGFVKPSPIQQKGILPIL